MFIKRALTMTITLGLAATLWACQGSQQGGQDSSDDQSAGMMVPTQSHPDTTGWNDLFARDFSNANLQSPDSWTWEDNVLLANDHSTIWTNESYGNFVLDFEFNLAEAVNSGIFIRTADTTDILSALEIQMIDYMGDNHSLGALYDLKAPTDTTAFNGVGTWNRMTITARDSMVYVVLNGRQVQRANLNRWTEAAMNPDGSENKFEDRAIMNQARSGPIGIQGIHGAEISARYRNLKIQRLGTGGNLASN